MRIDRLKSKDTKTDGFFVSITLEEAYRLIVSLTRQIMSNNPNTDREEFFENIKGNKQGYNYFTISVEPKPPSIEMTEIEAKALLEHLIPDDAKDLWDKLDTLGDEVLYPLTLKLYRLFPTMVREWEQDKVDKMQKRIAKKSKKPTGKA